jgi:hypothetical protein
MSTVGEVVRTVPTRKDLERMADETRLKAPDGRGNKAPHYYLTATAMMAEGTSWADAVQELATANNVSVANVKAGYARYAKENGHPATPEGSRTRRSSTGQTSIPRNAAIPKDLEPILDAIRKDRASLNANTDKLISWAQGQEAKVATAVDDAREAALRQIREAAASIR